MSSFDVLPTEIIIEIGLKLKISILPSYSRLSHKFNDETYNNENFWRCKFEHDYWPINHTGSWRKLYQGFMDVWVCRGDNHCGELGLGDTQNRNTLTQITGFKAKQISDDCDFRVMIDLNNKVWGCGTNDIRQLGLKSNEDVVVPTLISRDLQIQQISCGNEFTGIIDIEHNVWICGFSKPVKLTTQRKNKGMLTQLPNFKAKQISCGFSSMVMIRWKITFGNVETMWLEIQG